MRNFLFIHVVYAAQNQMEGLNGNSEKYFWNISVGGLLRTTKQKKT